LTTLTAIDSSRQGLCLFWKVGKHAVGLGNPEGRFLLAETADSSEASEVFWRAKAGSEKIRLSLSKTYAGQPAKSGAAACTSRPELIFTEGNPISRRKNRYLADFTTGIRRIQVKSGRGGSGGGACSPVHQTVKNTFLTV